jgi:hypothetical protein
MEKTAPKVMVRPDHFWPPDVVVVAAGGLWVVVVVPGTGRVVVAAGGLRVVVVVPGTGRVVAVEADVVVVVVLVVVLEVDGGVEKVVVVVLKADGGVEWPLEQAARINAARVSPTPTGVRRTGRPYLAPCAVSEIAGSRCVASIRCRPAGDQMERPRNWRYRRTSPAVETS